MSNFLILEIPILLLLLPIGFQIILGRKKLKNDKYLSFWLVSLLSIVLEILMTIIGLILSLKGQQMLHPQIRGLSPGFVAFGMFFTVILLIIIIVQYTFKIIKRNKNSA